MGLTIAITASVLGSILLVIQGVQEQAKHAESRKRKRRKKSSKN